MSATEVFDDADLIPGERRFTDGTSARDVDLLNLGFVTNGEVEERRTEARADNDMATLTRLAEIINATGGGITGRHRRLRKRDGTNRPPLFRLRNIVRWVRKEPRLEATLRTPWWISADRRQSYLNLTFLEEHGTIERLDALVKAGTVTPRRLIVLGRKKFLRPEVQLRLRRAASGEGLAIDDPVRTLADAVRHVDDWCRPRVHGMIRDAAEEGPEGALGVLFPHTLTPHLLDMLWRANLVGDTFRNALLGITEEEPADDAFKVNTGELRQVLEDGARITAGAG